MDDLHENKTKAQKEKDKKAKQKAEREKKEKEQEKKRQSQDKKSLSERVTEQLFVRCATPNWLVSSARAPV